MRRARHGCAIPTTSCRARIDEAGAAGVFSLAPARAAGAGARSTARTGRSWSHRNRLLANTPGAARDETTPLRPDPAAGCDIATLISIPAQAQPDSTATRAGSVTSTPAEKVVKQGFLFSAISFGDPASGGEWSRLRAEAQVKFPDLKLTRPEDLHITVVYAGDWKADDLDRVRAHALVVPASPGRMTPEVVRTGRNNQVVAGELHGAPQAWTDPVIAAKSALNRLGLKKAEGYDTSFRTHITLAQARSSPPSQADSTGLAGFMAWITPKIAEAPAKFSVEVGPKTRVELLPAGATRHEGSPEYIAVEAFLETQQAAAPAK
jgi:2'-5' RNA ligase